LIFVGTMMLEQSGYKVTGQSDGEAALIEFRQRPNIFDAVSQILHALHVRTAIYPRVAKDTARHP
jgi:hypothetical protein